MKFTVSVGYYEFVFDKAEEALAFAQKAKAAFVPSKYDDKEVKVTVVIGIGEIEA